MSKRASRLSDDRIPYEGHLTLAVSRLRTKTALHRQLTSLARETDLPMPTSRASAGGDPERLRGIPVAGRGISGTWNRSQPEGCVGRLDREMRRRYHELDQETQALVNVAAGIDGTSPGTQPEEALLAKEEGGAL